MTAHRIRPIGSRVRREAGFTLIELLIVVVIIGILAAIAIPQFAVTKAKAGDATAKSDLRNLVTAEEKYFNDNQTYTDQISDLRPQGFGPSANVTLSVQTFAGYYHADASHSLSTNCYWIAYGVGEDGRLQAAQNASSGGGDCGG